MHNTSTETNFFRRYIKKLPLTFFLLLLALLACLLFGIMVHEVLGEKEDAFDFAVLDYITRHVTTPGLTPIMEGFTFLASSGFLLIAYPALISICLYQKKKRQALDVALIGLIGFLINYALKFFFHRLRPTNPLVHPLKSFSFPSGHAMSAIIFYGLLVYIICHSKRSRFAKATLSALLILLIILIGFSRIYLRVHYPSDVVGGFCMGFAWLAFAIWYLEKLRHKTSNEFERNNSATKQN